MRTSPRKRGCHLGKEGAEEWWFHERCVEPFGHAVASSPLAPGRGEAMRHVLEIGEGTNHPLAGFANGECAKVVPGPARAKVAPLFTPPREEAPVMLFR